MGEHKWPETRHNTTADLLECACGLQNASRLCNISTQAWDEPDIKLCPTIVTCNIQAIQQVHPHYIPPLLDILACDYVFPTQINITETNIVELVANISTNVEAATENDQIIENYEVVVEVVIAIQALTVALSQADILTVRLYLSSHQIGPNSLYINYICLILTQLIEDLAMIIDNIEEWQEVIVESNPSQ